MDNILSLHKKIGNKTITERHIYTQEILRKLKSIEEKQTISYDDLSKTIGLDVRPQKEGYPYQYSARIILERENGIVFEVLKGEGFRRLTPEDVARGTGDVYQKRKKALITRSKRRIGAVTDHYDDLSDEGKIKVTIHRTILAFENEIAKPKNILKIEKTVQEHKQLVGFKDTLQLFEK
jgi:hypothetical protein